MHARTRRAPTRETAEPRVPRPLGRPAPGLSAPLSRGPFPGSGFSLLRKLRRPGDGFTICPDAVPPDVVRPVDLELLESRVERSGYSVDPYRAMSHRDAPLTPKRVLYNANKQYVDVEFARPSKPPPGPTHIHTG